MKTSRRIHRRLFTRIAASAIPIGALALGPCAHAINAYWMGGSSDDWDGSHWDVGGTGIGTSLLNSNDESSYDLYFGSGGYHDVNGIVTTTRSVSPSSLNFSQQNWTLNVGAIASGATSASSVHLNVNHTSPQVTINSTYGISFGTSLASSYMDMNVDTGSVLTLNANVYGRGSLNKYEGGTAVIASPYNQQRGSVISGTNVFAGTLITDNPINDYNIRAGATMGFDIPTDSGWGTRGDLSYGGNIYGDGSFVKKGGAVLIMTQDVYYTGSTTVEAGRLVVATFHNPYVTSSFTFNGGDLELRTGTSHQTYGDRISGTGSFTKSGSYNLTLTGTQNSAGGGVFVTGGSLVESAPMAQSYNLSGSAKLTWNASGLFAATISGTGSFTKAGDGHLTFSNPQSYTGGTTITGGTLVTPQPIGNFFIDSGATLVIPTNSDFTYSGLISGAGEFYKNGAATLTLTADYSTAPAGYRTGRIRVLNSRLIEQHPHGDYYVDFLDPETGPSDLEFANVGNVYFGNPSFPVSGAVGGTISGPGDFTKSGTGGLLLTAGMTHTGKTTVNQGDLVSLVSNALPSVTALAINSPGRFLTGYGLSQTVDTLAGSGNVILSGNTLTLAGGASATFSGVISSASPAGLTKNGPGTQTLSGQNTYTGDTLISGGALTLASGGALRFKVGANGVSNKLTGTGTLNLDGTLVLDLTTAGNAPGNAWTLVNTSTLAETYGSTFALASSSRGAFTKKAGKWTMNENGVTYEFVPATGVLIVVPLTGYALWAASHAGGQAADEDYNRDGVQNGIAYFMNNTGVITLPGIVGGKITWPNGGTIAATAYGTEFKVQTSSDLASWADIPTGDANLTNLAASVAYMLPSRQGRCFVRLSITPN
ncbi:autotransporter-associated beta strand repeat-containing protein [Luteolibacter ambystomatis]|uniref:Autotransporter-associated beta strand repeat-containing protein n=1 Tax=Luteolibacter ambystomatis TaxID=2824561 RepID=A0A975J286_9BACT|nr:autotransporter-associated beta strand repeat-containing protein [Luteolibacter ambystomatis]QUE52641.1 autotransporter-associated beta strand repeat-containing protein [Luteolibacter ambystomatis]